MSLISLVSVIERYPFKAHLGPALRRLLNAACTARSFVRVGDATSPEFEQWEIEGRLFRIIQKTLRDEIVLQEIVYDEHDVFRPVEVVEIERPPVHLNDYGVREDRVYDPVTGEFK